MLFFALLIAFAERAVLPMAITRMVAIPNQNATVALKSEAICVAPEWGASNSTGQTVIDQAVSTVSSQFLLFLFNRIFWQRQQLGAKFNWTQEQQGMILSAFYIGPIFFAFLHKVLSYSCSMSVCYRRLYCDANTWRAVGREFRRKICTWTRHYDFSGVLNGNSNGRSIW